MIRCAWLALLACLPLESQSQSGGFSELSMKNGADTTFAQYSLRLAGPDNPDKPVLWEGPLTIANGSSSCTADISLISSIYAAPGASFVIALSSSGSKAVVHFVDAASCASKWPDLKLSASRVRAQGNRLAASSVCEGGSSNEPSLCTSARVYEIGNDAPPSYLRSESYKLTRKELGVGFTGEAKVMDPRTPRAIIVH
jgi:hypothetical protein